MKPICILLSAFIFLLPGCDRSKKGKARQALPPPPVLTLASGGSLGTFRKSFKENQPAEGWKYLWNSDSAIGTAANYKPLVWNVNLKAYTINAEAFPAPSPGGYLGVFSSELGPGFGSLQSEDKIDRFVIVSYTIPTGKAGRLSTVDSNIVRPRKPDEKAPGTVELRIYVNDTAKHKEVVNANTLVKFDMSLGEVKAGDTVSIAVGPDGDGDYDGFDLDFGLELKQ